MVVAFSVIFMADLEKQLIMASPLKHLFGRGLSMTYFLCGTFQWKKFPSLLTSPTLSTLRSNLLVKCHPNVLFFLTQRYSKDLTFQLLKFLIHKPTLRLLQTFTGVLQRKICMRAVFNETPTNYILIQRL